MQKALVNDGPVNGAAEPPNSLPLVCKWAEPAVALVLVVDVASGLSAASLLTLQALAIVRPLVVFAAAAKWCEFRTGMGETNGSPALPLLLVSAWVVLLLVSEPSAQRLNSANEPESLLSCVGTAKSTPCSPRVAALCDAVLHWSARSERG